MPNTTSHILHQMAPDERRLYWGSEISHLLILWLNSTKGTARSKRVAALLELIDRCTAALAKIRKQDPQGEGRVWWEGRAIKGGSRLQAPFGSNEVKRAMEPVEAALRRYTFRAELAYGYGNRLLLDWVPANQSWRKSADRIGGPSPQETYFIFTETHAVASIVELCHEGLIDRVRLCSCGMWFYAKFSHQKFHSQACQQKAYRDNPEWKAHRRDYMKRNRALHAEHVFRSPTEPIRPHMRKRGE